MFGLPGSVSGIVISMNPNDKAGRKPKLTPVPDGPFAYENGLHPEGGGIFNSRGEDLPCGSEARLCRCGNSSNKPFCDGTHAKVGFDSKNVSDRRLDSRHSYVGKGITIHWNPIICSHAGFCWQELPDVFRLDRRPWIDPDAAEPAEIMKVIDKCPSGALSYSVDGVEKEDPDREPRITVTRNGPYCLTGGIEVVSKVPRGEGVTHEHCSCCRCGASRNKPYCDGAHILIGFEDDKN